MKLFNIFKKDSSKEVKSNVQKMDKKQLSKVIGGGDGGTSLDSTAGAINTSRSNIKSPT